MFDVEGQLGDATRHSISDIEKHLKELVKLEKEREKERIKDKAIPLTLPTSVHKMVDGIYCWYTAEFICHHDNYVTYNVTKKFKKNTEPMNTESMVIDVKRSEVTNFLKNMGNYYENMHKIAMNGLEYKVIRAMTHVNYNSFTDKSEYVTEISFDIPEDWNSFTDFDPKKDCEDEVLDRVLVGGQTFVYVIKMWVTGHEATDMDTADSLINAYIKEHKED